MRRVIRTDETLWPWTRGVVVLLAGAALVAVLSVGVALFTFRALHQIYFDRHDLPDLGLFTRFEFPQKTSTFFPQRCGLLHHSARDRQSQGRRIDEATRDGRPQITP